MHLPPPASLITEPLNVLLALMPLALAPPTRICTRQDHFAPHPDAPFEGYYTRVQTAGGATILLIFSSVFAATDKPHFVHFSYIPHSGSTSGSNQWRQQRIVVNKFPRITDTSGPQHADGGVHEFSRVAKGDGVEGTLRVCRDQQRYRLEFDLDSAQAADVAGRGGVEATGLVVSVDLTRRRPWHARDELSTPEGALAQLVHLLPLHWNVFSTASTAAYSVTLGDRVLSAGTGIAHMEKNWGASFPRGWTWVQGFSVPTHSTPTTSTYSNSTSSSTAPEGGYHEARTLVMAGGKTLGQKAYLVGYRGGTAGGELSYGPPWTLMPFCRETPFVAETHDFSRGTARVRVGSLRHRLVVEVQAPPPAAVDADAAGHSGQWLGLHCPLADGHARTLAYESFEGSVRVRVYRRSLWSLLLSLLSPLLLLVGGGGRGSSGWQLVEETMFDGAAVEFGGDYCVKARRDEQ